MNRSVPAAIVLTAFGAAAMAASAKTEEGVRLFDARSFPEARAVLEAAAREDPRDARALYYLGRTLYAQSETAKAAEWLEKAVALDPGSADKHRWLARVWGTLAQSANVFKQASLAPKIRREFERTVELDPENTEARSDLMEFYIQAPGIMGGSIEKARVQAAEIARRDRLRGYVASARIADYEGHPDAALAEYDRAALEFPDRIDPVIGTVNLRVKK
ncbi:MAG TPA: tetratricopeptide repeat protein, partial [Thermoanaerobaculia bacterium]|nr:tetratricopeptide repeat protein [Thermoanaerobaculia bacterium]